ncbi:MAG: 3-methyl-2-oxobutanoate hydroxymethyltransferase [Opitutales bacterium]
MRNIPDFQQYRDRHEPITMVTSYDAWSARLAVEAGIDALLVGDSVAMVMHGLPDTVHADIDMMVLHTAAVRRGAGDRQLVIADMPFPTHRLGPEKALEAADRLMKAGANAIKIEGIRGHETTIRHLVDSGVPVMGHLGLTPQQVHTLGGYKVQGRDPEAASQMREDALATEQAGAFALVLECVPAERARSITEQLHVPTIGIGSGVGCSGQILVLQDLLGLNGDFHPRFLRTYLDGRTQVVDALQRYREDVRSAAFPSPAESFA